MPRGRKALKRPEKTMKRDGHIIEEITAYPNLIASFDQVLRGNKRKALAEGKWLLAHQDEFLEQVKQEILSGDVRLSVCHEKNIVEHGKERHIQVFRMKDRIKINAVMAVVDEHLRKRFIRTTSASIKGRGMHDLKKCIERDMRQDPTLRYWYKFDIRKFYESVRQEFVLYAINRVFKDKKLIGILTQFVRLIPDGVGMSMGMRSSQGLCNLLLSVYLDHYLKDRYGVKHFYRYCDDGLIGASNKRELWQWCNITHGLIEAIGQQIKPNERVFPIEQGVDFLGYVIYPDHSRLRKRVKQDFARKLARVKSRKRRQQIVGAFYGMAKHADARHLMNTLLTKKEMKKFSELHITYTPADGKKRFPNKSVQLRSLVNVEIEVLDFERDVQTKYGLRWLVMFRDTRTNETAKFFTDCDEMKKALEAAQEMGEIPFASVISAEYFGDNKTKYIFT